MRLLPMPRRPARPLWLSGLLGLLSIQAASAQIPPTYNDVVFATVPRDAGGTINLLMDIYIPPGGGPGPKPLVLWIHGGGWEGGTQDGVPPGVLALRDYGFVVASTSYRLSGDAIFPAQIQDVKGAIRYLRANAATYNLNPTRFVSWGSSAGGHLSALLATSAGVSSLEGSSGGNLGFSSAVQVCVDYFGPTDILDMNLDVTNPPGSTLDHDSPASPESHLVGWDAIGQGIGDIRANEGNPNPPYPALVDLCNQVNPITWLAAGDPPTFIAHGMIDTTVPMMQSTRLANALAAAGITYEYHQIPGAGHGTNFPPEIDTAAQSFILAQFGSPVMPADLNCDGQVNIADIPPFVQKLITPPAYTAQHPTCNPLNGDLNHDDRVDGQDIALFADRLVP